MRDSIVSGGAQLCAFDRFYNAECADVRGTGFLVDDAVIATAGHLVQIGVSNYTEWLESVYFVFEYVMETEGRIKRTFTEDEVYKGIEVLADHSDGGADWALIKLDRAVTGREPLACRTLGKVEDGSKLYMIGHPHGMPMKYSGPGAIFNNDPCHFFLSDLDTHPYNSGSPVFNTNDNLVEGILARDVGDFSEYCNCVATLVFTSQMGVPGVEVTRSFLFTWFLERPEHIIIKSTVPAATVKTLVNGIEYTAHLGAGEEGQLPSGGIDVQLLGYVDDCWIPYSPKPGEIWEIVPDTVSNMNVMVKVCE